MRKVCLLVTLVLVFAFSSVAEQIDLKSMGDDELIAMKDAISEEIIERGLEIDTDFYPGTYVCGVDIRPGVYYLYPKDVQLAFTLKWYKTKEDAKDKKYEQIEYIMGDTKYYRLVIEEGDIFGVEVVGVGSIGIRTTKPVWAP